MEGFFNKVNSFFIYLYLFSLSFFPSGTFLNYPVKLFLFLFVILLFVFSLIYNKINKGEIIYLFSIVLFSIIYTFISIVKVYAIDYYYIELNIFLGLFLSFFVICYYINHKIISANGAFYSILLGVVFFGLLKILAVVLIYFNIFSYEKLIILTKLLFNYNFVSMPIADNIIRINFINLDMLSLFVMVILNFKFFKVNLFLKLLFGFIILVSLFVAYSRLLFFVLFIFSFFYFIDRCKKISFKDIVCLLILLFAILTFLLKYYSFLEDAITIILDRFTSDSNVESDYLREMQYQALTKSISENIWFGNGFGAFSQEFVRDSDNPFTYEMQWLAFLLKFGILGTIWIFMLYLYSIIPLKKSIISSNRIVVILFSIFILSGLTNQYLFSSTVSSILVLLYISNNKELNEKK